MELNAWTDRETGEAVYELIIPKEEMMLAMVNMTQEGRLAVKLSDRDDRSVVERLVVLTRVAASIEGVQARE